MSDPVIPNDSRIVDDREARTPIVKAEGLTESERYLAKLGEKSFFNLWSYPNVFTDRGKTANGEGKELCDLLVVCGDHIIIFSDKTIAWPFGDEQVAWKRWYKRAILSSADQVKGAARWLTQFPERIFLDRACTQPLPISDSATYLLQRTKNKMLCAREGGSHKLLKNIKKTVVGADSCCHHNKLFLSQ